MVEGWGRADQSLTEDGLPPSFLTLRVQGDSLVVCAEVDLVTTHLFFLHPPVLLPALASEGLCWGPVVVGGKLQYPGLLYP